MAEDTLTLIAQDALGLADRFALSLGGESIRSGALEFRLDLAAPEGASTGGGERAVQHIKLSAKGGPTVVLGLTNVATKSAELRSYDHLVAVHARRFKGEKLPFSSLA
ncbi:MAG: hypothetical protein EXR72_07770 [Myxococcales bacterium]|nr:hypothetical protein [Myxococcales bacterium]